MITLGQKAKDKITGFEGIITGYVHYLYGCDQYCIVAPSKDNKTGESGWYVESSMRQD